MSPDAAAQWPGEFFDPQLLPMIASPEKQLYETSARRRQSKLQNIFLVGYGPVSQNVFPFFPL